MNSTKRAPRQFYGCILDQCAKTVSSVHQQFVKQLRMRTAELAVGPSTVRGVGNKGVVRAARSALKGVRLSRFAVSSRSAFLAALDRETELVRLSLPRGARHWGIARKVLNIYLRSVVFNRHLCAAYYLARVERWLELPLDEHVANGIASVAAAGSLPRWQTIKGLSPEVSALYQSAARKAGKARGVPPIHLEYLWWRV